MAFDDLMERMKPRAKVRIVYNGVTLDTLEHPGRAVFAGQRVFLELEAKAKGTVADTSFAPTIKETYEIVSTEYEDDTVIAHVQLAKENA